MGCRLLAQCVVITHLVPGKMWRDIWRGACQLVDDAAILQLVVDVAWLTRTGKAGKTRTACAHTPGRHGHGKVHGALGHLLDRDAAPCQLPSQCGKVFRQLIIGLGIPTADKVGRNREAHGLPREGRSIAGIDIEEIARGFCREVGGEEIDAFGNILGKYRTL